MAQEDQQHLNIDDVRLFNQVALELDTLLNDESIDLKSNTSAYFEIHRLYAELQVFEDSLSNYSIQGILDEPLLFKKNNTLENFNPESTYWSSLKLKGLSDRDSTLLFDFSTDGWSKSWNSIDAWLVHEDHSIEYLQTGNRYSNTEKPISAAPNLLELTIKQKQKAVIILRLAGINEEPRKTPDHISYSILDRSKNQGVLQGYPFTGSFSKSNYNGLFNTNPILTHQFYVDKSGVEEIDYINQNWNRLPTSNVFNTPHEVGKVYWMKQQFYGTEKFNGEQIFHISSRPKWAGKDIFSFDYIDCFSKQKDGSFRHEQTGDQIKLKDRSYHYWMNFIKFDIPFGDTLDVYIRLEGADDRFLMSDIVLYHIDPSSLFPEQINEALEQGIFFGILGIQFLFFIIVFCLDRNRIHFFFAIFILGLMMTFAFPEDIFSSYVLFPTWRDYHVPLFFTGVFMFQCGIIKLTEIYFKVSKELILSKWIIPVYIAVSAFASTHAIIQFEYNLDYGNPATEYYVLFVLLLEVCAIIFSLYIAITAAHRNNISKKFYLFAFLPVALVGLFHIGGIVLSASMGNTFFYEVFFPLGSFDMMRISIVLMLTLFALSIGYRNNRLYADRKLAIGLKEKNIIIEQKSRHNEMLAKEIHHRVKNNLQILSSLLSLQSGFIEDDTAKDALIEGRNRVEAMSLIHQKLYGDVDMTNVNLMVYIPELCRYLEDSFSSNDQDISISETVNYNFLDVDYAIPLGLIINELVTNSVKYAYPSGEAGRIELSLIEEKDELILMVRDFGESQNQYLNKTISNSFGSKLIEALSQKLKGRIVVNSHSGYSTHIAFSRYK